MRQPDSADYPGPYLPRLSRHPRLLCFQNEFQFCGHLYLNQLLSGIVISAEDSTCVVGVEECLALQPRAYLSDVRIVVRR